MSKIKEVRPEFEGLQVWKVIGVFALVFVAVQLAVAFFGIGINFIMRQLSAGENVRVFIGSTISRASMIAATLWICAPVIRKVFFQDPRKLLFPFASTWKKDLLAGLVIGLCAMTVVFGFMLLTGWLSLDGLALTGQTPQAWLRAIWLALLVNLTAAVSEEVLFRGVLLTGLKEAWDENGAVFISAVIFAASHILATGASETNWLQFVPLLALPGLMLGWAYLRTGNLWLATGLHFAWNMLQDDVFNLTARKTSETLFGLATMKSGPDWFMGTAFGLETGLAGVLAVILAGVGVWYYTRKIRVINK